MHSTRFAILAIVGWACGGATTSPAADAGAPEASPGTCHDVSLLFPPCARNVLNDLPPRIDPTEPPPPPGIYGLVTLTDYVGPSGDASYLGMTVRIDPNGRWEEVVESGDGEPSSHLHPLVTRRTFVLVPSANGDEYESFVECGAKSSEASMRFWRRPDGRWLVRTQVGTFPRVLVLEAK